MAAVDPRYEVKNQSDLPVEKNRYLSNTHAQRFIEARNLDESSLIQYGQFLGTKEADKMAREANDNSPVLNSFNRIGERIDQVNFHPSYNYFMDMAMKSGVGSFPEKNGKGHLERALKLHMLSEIEPGHGCPISMTYAAVATLEEEKSDRTTYLSSLIEKLRHQSYDPREVPISQKQSITSGMGMTERQGGSDVRANITFATKVGGDRYQIFGHKWFMSAPQSDLFLVTAQTDRGVTCFTVARRREDGALNSIQIQRLKSKIGNRSNASSEVVFDGSEAHIVGEEGRGIATIIKMVSHCRLDSLIGSAGEIRSATVDAIDHARARMAFGRMLIDTELMEAVLGDMVIESIAATMTSLRLALCDDNAPFDEGEGALRRIGVPLAKFLVCKRAPTLIAEAVECLGGNGYVEESRGAILFRESPLNGMWEGSGNVNALDLLRVMNRDQMARDQLFSYLKRHSIDDIHLKRMIGDCEEAAIGEAISESRARSLATRLAKALQLSVLVEGGYHEVATEYLKARIVPRSDGDILGTIEVGRGVRELIDTF
ncbi:MAG: acyl-CoA dehydrogenase family protein [Actinomycetota bacterium]|nr:acyl-CoA dehydrogenase family protein [Actinomycetota bacterium]